MITHDPRQVIEDLRNHLATHDRHLTFLFGAGTSSAINIAAPPPAGTKPTYEPLIPGIDGLTALCHTAVAGMGQEQSKAWTMLAKQCEDDGQCANIENVLSRIRVKIDAVRESETLLGLNRTGLREIERAMCSAIAKAVIPHEDKIPKRTPQDDFALWVKKVSRAAPLEVFTTNYDVLFDRAFEAARVPVFDGFVGTYRPFFYPECLDDESLLPEAKWVRLWKLHGSVNWVIQDGPSGKRVVRTHPTESGEVILPSQRKYDESRKQPYMAFMDRLSRVLNSDHAFMITCGYAFGDEHINAILYAALDNRNTANIIALQFQDSDENDGLVRAAAQRSNLTVIAPNGGVISGAWGLWQLNQPVDNKTCSFMDIAFDSNASPEDEGSPAATSADLHGRVRLGDFNWFCRFLNAMGLESQ